MYESNQKVALEMAFILAEECSLIFNKSMFLNKHNAMMNNEEEENERGGESISGDEGKNKGENGDDVKVKVKVEVEVRWR